LLENEIAVKWLSCVTCTLLFGGARSAEGIGTASTSSIGLVGSNLDCLVCGISSLPILLRDHGESSELLELIERHEASGGTATQSIDGIQCIGRDGAVERSAEVLVGLVVTLCIDIDFRHLAIHLPPDEGAASESGALLTVE
jgi:hypothetical protein